jgi:hypothetical protein
MEKISASRIFSTEPAEATHAPFFMATPQIWTLKSKPGSMGIAFQSINVSDQHNQNQKKLGSGEAPNSIFVSKIIK